MDCESGSVVTLSGCVLIGLSVGRVSPDWRLTGRLAPSLLAAPERVAPMLRGSAVIVPGTRYFGKSEGLAAADAIETPELPCAKSLRKTLSLDSVLG